MPLPSFRASARGAPPKPTRMVKKQSIWSFFSLKFRKFLIKKYNISQQNFSLFWFLNKKNCHFFELEDNGKKKLFSKLLPFSSIFLYYSQQLNKQSIHQFPTRRRPRPVPAWRVLSPPNSVCPFRMECRSAADSGDGCSFRRQCHQQRCCCCSTERRSSDLAEWRDDLWCEMVIFEWELFFN